VQKNQNFYQTIGKNFNTFSVFVKKKIFSLLKNLYFIAKQNLILFSIIIVKKLIKNYLIFE
jgi:hypothetical protein